MSTTKSRPRSFLQRMVKGFLSVFLIFLLLFLLGAEVGGSVYFVMTQDLPDLRTVEDFRPALITEVYDRYGNLIGTHATERRRLVPLNSLPRHIIFAFLAAEDADFYLHRGLDLPGIGRAMIANLKAGRISQGASTITQQVVRNLLLTPERTVERKVREWILAWRLEQRMSKDEILYIYLNLVFFGSRAYGVEAAAQTYFGIPARELDLAQAAMLAGLVQAPSRLSKEINLEKAKRRQEWILDQMAEHLFITPEEAAQAKAEPIKLQNLWRDPPLVAPYFQNEVQREMVRILGPKKFAEGGYKVYTTLDPYLQKYAEEAVARGAERLDRSYHRGNRKLEVLSPEEQKRFLADETAKLNRPLVEGEIVYGVVTGLDRNQVQLQIGPWPATLDLRQVPWHTRRKWARQVQGQEVPLGGLLRVKVSKNTQTPIVVTLAPDPEIESALVSINPQTREVLALVGGYDYTRSVYNRATQSRRPPGSAMKPIVYSAAFSSGQFRPNSVVCDCPRAFTDDRIHYWRPKNYDNSFHGYVTLHTALVHSLNVATVVVAHEIGIQAVIDRAHEMGLTEAFPHALAISLGAYGVSLLELTNAYAVFASYGQYKPPTFITKIVDRDGKVVYSSAKSQPLYVLSEEEAFLMVHLLQHVVTDGTGKWAMALGRPSAGKTGTTSDHRDAWYIGFTPELVTGVWVGRDDFLPIGYGVTGGHSALPIWLDYTKNALAGAPVAWFEPPPGVSIARLDPVGTSLPRRMGEGEAEKLDAEAQQKEAERIAKRRAEEQVTTEHSRMDIKDKKAKDTVRSLIRAENEGEEKKIKTDLENPAKKIKSVLVPKLKISPPSDSESASPP